MIWPDDYINKIICGDCLEVMQGIPDGAVDLVLTDPPYGIHKTDGATGFLKNRGNAAFLFDKRPGPEIINLIRRKTYQWAIWGGNYLADMLGSCTAPIVWDKKTGDNYFADGEIAWTNFPGTLRIIRHQWCGAFKDSERGKQAVHPTQKPVAIMRWIIDKHSKPNDIILDPFAGSGTTCVAAKQLGRQWIGIEINPDYCKIADERLRQEELF